MLKRVLAASLPLVCLAAAAAAQTSPPVQTPQTLTIPKVTVPPRIDDYLDGTPRGDEAAITEFFQREPGDGPPASQPTEAYLAYDDQNLYVAFIARDREPHQVRANLTRREGFGNDDFVGVILDTFHDRRRAYLFIVNPHGVQLDGVTTEGQDDDYSFDTLWRSEGRLTPFGYVVWMAIPFKSMRFPATAEQDWGFAVARVIPRSNETSFFPYMTRRVTGMGQQLATLRGLRDISPGRNMQFIPYAAAAHARFLDEPRPRYVTDTDGRAGLDGKMVVKDAFTLDLTFNPDFSQVESDEPQVTINQRFEVFFPEKRPFFIENASYFESPINLFFSRRVADPQVGARLTGKRGGWALAALAIDDRAPARRLDPGEPGAGDRAGIGVLRVQRELPRQSNVGILATTRAFGGGASHVVSIDGRWKIDDHWVLEGQAAASRTRPFEGASSSGPALTLNLDRSGRNWGAFVEYEDISAEFNAPLGFVQRVDYRQVHPFWRYTWYPARGPLVSLGPEFSGGALWDQRGALQEWDVRSEFQLELKGQTEIELNHQEEMERFAGIEFRKRETSVGFETGWLKWFEFSTNVERGNEINFFPGEGVEPFLADSTNAEVSLSLMPVAPLRLDQTYLFTRLETRAGLVHTPPGASIVDNHILRTRVGYQFTRALSLRAIVDYSAVLPDTALIDLEREKRFTADFLVTYLLNPWTAVYVGYTDGYGNVEIDPIARDRLRPTDSPFHSTGRQVFVKTSYLLRF
ncbi:MAG TPA: DUF5916 domain-containing protein [Vicinamibacterales bacterium]|nr:DUF5916 domain-containing protein [Vicinamibacterales bacterium]